MVAIVLSLLDIKCLNPNQAQQTADFRVGRITPIKRRPLLFEMALDRLRNLAVFLRVLHLRKEIQMRLVAKRTQHPWQDLDNFARLAAARSKYETVARGVEPPSYGLGDRFGPCPVLLDKLLDGLTQRRCIFFS